MPVELLLFAQIRTKSFLGCGFAPDPTGGAYSTQPDPLAGLGGRDPPGSGNEGEERKVKGVQECPNPELASLIQSNIGQIRLQLQGVSQSLAFYSINFPTFTYTQISAYGRLNLSFLARDVIYTSHAYATMSVSVSV